jgi:methionyl-tRNA formyltransferase
MIKPRLCFAGTPEFAAAHLQALLRRGFDIAAVYTQPDRPAGRGNKLQPSPVKQVALAAGLKVLQPASLKPEQEQEHLRQLQADLLVVVAYGLILPAAILQIPRLGCINVHASLLPRWRGAAPIERALLAGDAETGITIMQMDAGLDTGAMLLQQAVPISASDDRQMLENKLEQAGTSSLVYALDHLQELQAKAETQDDSQTSYAAKLDKSEALIDWTQPATLIDRVVRAGIGRFPAYSFIAGQRLRILKARVEIASGGGKPGQIVAIGKHSLTVACGEDNSIAGQKCCRGWCCRQCPANSVAARQFIQQFRTG